MHSDWIAKYTREVPSFVILVFELPLVEVSMLFCENHTFLKYLL